MSTDRQAYKEQVAARLQKALDSTKTPEPVPVAPPEPTPRRELHRIETAPPPLKQRREVSFGLPPSTPERERLLELSRNGTDEDVSRLHEFDKKMGF